MTALRMFLVGRAVSGWERTLLRQLASLASPHDLSQAATISEALVMARTREPDLVVVIQSSPDQYSPAEVQRLLATLPLTRLIVCHGPWCSGDGRNRETWPLAVRIPHDGFFARLADELAALAGYSTGLSWTAGRDEIAAAELSGPTSHPDAPFTFHLVSGDAQFTAMFDAQLAALGGHRVPVPETQLLLIDIDPWSASMARNVLDLISRANPVRTFLLTSSPNSLPPGEIEAAGPTTVIDKLTTAVRPDQLSILLAGNSHRRSA